MYKSEPTHLPIQFQFNCTNTLNDQILENVSVQMETGDECEVVDYIACPVLKYGTPSATYTVVQFAEDPSAGSFTRHVICL